MKEKRPPKLAEKFLLLFLKGDLAEEVLGDLDEKFYLILDTKSLRKARRNYWYQVFNYLRPFAFKLFRSNSIFTTMVKHNFLIGYRILLKNKAFSVINIGGLAMGMTVAILIGLWIQDELSFNKNHENYEQIVQVLRRELDDGVIEVNSSHVGQVGVFMKENYSHMFDKIAMTFYRMRPQLLTVGRQSFDQKGYFIEPDAPEMLTLEMLAGTRDGLRDPDGIILSKSLARTFFNDENPIGKTVTINTRKDLFVTGVYEDLPANSTFSDATFMASLELIYNEENPHAWNNYNLKVYAQLKDGVDIGDASATIKDIMAPHIDPGETMDLLLIPMKDWHLNSNFVEGNQVTSSQMQLIKLYGLIGLFVLVLACINFMNLNTARYQNRGKEVGIRKAVGSLRSQLINQFLAESLLYALAAFVISIVALILILPWFNGISDKGLTLPFTNIWFWILGLAFTLFTALIAGSYPAIFLSSFGPIKALRGNLKQGLASVRFRQGLVIFQFTISIILIIGTIAIYNQIQHAKTRPVGYNQDGLITVRGRSSEFYKKYDILREELKQTGMVTEIAEANYPLMNTLGNNGGFRLKRTDELYDFSFNTIFVTHEYGKATEWELIAGRDFSRELGDETYNIIISESAVKRMGLENPVGERLLARHEFRGRKKEFTIIGVVKDMVKGSPYEPAMPLMVFATEESESYLFIRIKPGLRYVEALPKVQEAFERALPSHPFNYEFVDDEYARKFRSEERIGSIATFFSVLAILISCLGLFGLSAFIVEQRTKEIGIRKVLGASVTSLWQLLSRDFSFLVLVACLVAIPLASYFLGLWLNGYEYRIEIHWWIYAIAGLSCLAITLLTVSFHSMKASLSNPVESLRSE